jgi:two-component system C4-dicarboxylate transport sensor histidine kinase DctB
MLLVAWLAYSATLRLALADTETRGTATLQRHAQDLLASVERFEHLPYLVGEELVLKQLLSTPNDAQALAAANHYLAFAQQRTDVFAIYLMDTAGQTLAASNWNTPLSFVGNNYRFRPYFHDALGGQTGRFYGIGVTTGEPGFFIAAPLRKGSKVVGVVAVKIDLNAFEDKWRAEGLRLAVTDDLGVLFLSAEAGWRYHSLYPLDEPQQTRLRETRQYGRELPTPLLEQVAQPPSWPLQAMRIGKDNVYAQGMDLGRQGWRLLLFSDPAPARARAWQAAGVAVLSLSLLVVLLALRWTHRRRLAEQEASRREKARMVTELENRIAVRTAELTAANDTAVQTGKLALLGQMAAGISHELSQPLTALRTVADNAKTFLDRQDTDNAQRNLQLIGDLCTRMGSIVTELKAFARKEPARLQPVSIQQVLRGTLMLIEPLRQSCDCRITCDPTDALVLGDPIRLEQVMVNLLRNGIEAMDQQPTREITINIKADAGCVTVSVRDHGPGLSEEVLAHLFEPFFTTKPTGKGLGLGLSLSLAIVREMGGTIQASNAAPGARFDITLPQAEHEPL